MFTGLIEELGTVKSVRRAGRSLHLTVGAQTVLEQIKMGDSVAVNGCCLTVIRFDHTSFTADVMPETFARTNLGGARPGARVNLERTLRLGDRFGGHIVQGHVDGTGTIHAVTPDEIAIRFTIDAPPEILRYLVPKGSVAIDGISLTVVSVDTTSFTVSAIPHTASVTTLGLRKPGETVNLEADILAKYVERMLRVADAPAPAGRPGALTAEFLAEHGFR